MIQTVKCSPLVDIKLNEGFYYALCTLNLVQKIISSVIFDTNCSFKQENALS